MGNAHRHGESLPRRARDRVRAFPPRIRGPRLSHGGRMVDMGSRTSRLCHRGHPPAASGQGHVDGGRNDANRSVHRSTHRRTPHHPLRAGGALLHAGGPCRGRSGNARAGPRAHTRGNGGNGPRLDASGDTRASTDTGDGGFGGGDVPGVADGTPGGDPAVGSSTRTDTESDLPRLRGLLGDRDVDLLPGRDAHGLQREGNGWPSRV